ncbi:MAG: hypothetical protein R6U04_14055 [Bacteroidales bacterium]
MEIIEIFLEPLFWVIMGGLYVFTFYSATLWAQDLGIKMNWWKWTLTALWFLFLTLSIAGGFTLIGENEARPGLYFLGFSLIITFILGVILWRILTFNKEKE